MTRRARANALGALRALRALGALGVILLGACAFLAWLGYFGGPVFERFDPPTPARGPSAVVLSGDMGLRVGASAQIAQGLADRGIPVTAVNSLTYWRIQRTPAETAALIASATRDALRHSANGRVLLVGQSFGADMLHLGLAAMPPELRRHVQLVALMVPTDTLYYRASPSELFSLTPPDGDAIASGRRLDWVQTLCVYGAEEQESLCPHLRQANVWQVKLPGGHSLNKDVPAVLAALSTAIDASNRT